MAVPKRKKSRANTRARRSQWKASVPGFARLEERGRPVFYLPHRARRILDSNGNELFMEYKGRRVG
ncbi:50S ribosomal protein L32 [Tropheryma whipplei]|uniref:Large ribosomal subunit protein bL32 n=2 Tax=Tropheryma whipplei TaxID=2039 RepID=RL32_TROWT|nr:50S ribosomal protein L32 [Tropheryma whipplei]Q83FY1.1 RecName: Full=Large ribosomal subunit protein bL32; AltName: Full=50S ribosomal protein L32 [Tropheryma whipplei str. Twist]Q83I83.1 RecName: Full=Large ribosomal subunit protein bL32; AltName: Full=50S ribosomal protein L32 [Tropheryma whipplei TW08/27]AAO44660.1 50S ribosomal protein L32 [Tropheryma whipplei str. Twist]MCO8182590.1 50S ribosomal protein L32 [Tropheryma whipplei]MCO8189942.1 50S ribosomal protein L32 [Tropheryma whipp